MENSSFPWRVTKKDVLEKEAVMTKKKRQKQKKYQQEEEKGFRNDEETVIYAEEMCDCCMHFWVLQVLFFLFVLTTLTLKESI